MGLQTLGYSLCLVVSILYPAARALYPRDSFRKSVSGLCLHRRLEVCGDVPGILDAHRLCPTDATLRGKSWWLLFWCSDQVIMENFVVSPYIHLMTVFNRLAIELGLNRDSNVRPLDERHERELLNRRRTWMICSIMDGSTSLETGKAPGVGKDDEVFLRSLVVGRRLN